MKRNAHLSILTVLALATALATAAVVGVADAQKRGGVLRVGNLGEPPALDAHWTTASITETLTNHIYEGLYSLDSGARPIPMLAESHTVSKDGLAYTFKLRQGIKFHNGKEMTSDDVVASLTRWGKQSSYGKALFAQVAEFRAVDPLTVQMQLKEKSAIVLISLAVPNNFGAIYPKEIAEKFAPEVKVTEYVAPAPTSSPNGSRINTSGWCGSTTTSRATRSPTATAGARPRGSTRSAGSRCRRWRPGWPRWRPASSTSRTT